MKLKNEAFTLAEVLITLVIIGVIAAITVPSVMNNIEKREIVVSLKKAFSVLSQATDQIIMEEGPASYWAKSPESIYNLYQKKLNIAKLCPVSEPCVTTEVNYLKGNKWGDFKTYFVLQDGMKIDYYEFDGDCSKSNLDSGDYCGWFLVDLNGDKKPNKLGRDIFRFSLKENGLYPEGVRRANDCTTTERGWTCSYKVLYEGKIDY